MTQLERATELYRKGLTYREIGKEFKVSPQRICQILEPVKDKKRILAERKRARILQKMRKCKICTTAFLSSNKKQDTCSNYCGGVDKQTKWPNGEKNPYPRKSTKGTAWRYQMMKKYFPNKLKRYSKNAQKALREDQERYEKFKKYQREYKRKS